MARAILTSYAYPKLLWGSILVYAAITLPFLGAILLSYDEAHYALYGYKLAWSYFDHPPLVGWIQALMQLGGSHEWLLRLPAFLASCAVLFGIWYFLAKLRVINYASVHECQQHWLFALLLFFSAPMFLLLSFALLPDTLLMALVFPLVIQTHKAAVSNRWQDYALLGLLFGLAGLAKYTAILPALGAVAYVFWVRGWRSIINWHCWLGLVLAVAVFSPVMLWNLANNGASFNYQFNHGLGAIGGGLKGALEFNWQNIFIGQALQLAAFGPLLYCLGLMAAVWVILQRRVDLYILVFFAAPCFLLFLVSPAFGKFLPHWVSYMFVALLPAAAIMLQSWWYALVKRHHVARFRLRHMVPAGPKQWSALIIILTLAALSYVITVPLRLLVSGLPVTMPAYAHPAASVVGWDDMAQRINTVIPDDEVIFVNNWSYASPLAWYARPTKVVVLDKRVDQFDYWFGSPRLGQSGFLVVPHFDPKGHERQEDFSSCELWDSQDYKVGANPALKLDLYRCMNLHRTN